MNDPIRPWISLNTKYFFAPVGNPLDLLDDANLLLESARDLARSLSDTLHHPDNTHDESLPGALWGLATLIELGQSAANEANIRLSKAHHKKKL